MELEDATDDSPNSKQILNTPCFPGPAQQEPNLAQPEPNLAQLISQKQSALTRQGSIRTQPGPKLALLSLWNLSEPTLQGSLFVHLRAQPAKPGVHEHY